MKKIIHNNDNLSENDITETVTRIKALLINKEDIMIGYSDNVYHFPGGHLEEGEKFSECLKREIMEECGIEIKEDDIKDPIMYASQLCKDYPEKGKNRKSEIYYYVINTDKKPNIEKTNLTEQEIKGNFEIRTIPLKNSIEELKRNIPNNKRNESIAPDMIEAIKEYFRLNENYICKIPSLDEMEVKWNYEIENAKEDKNNWIIWKEKAIENFKNKKSIPYYGILNNKIICEATALLDTSTVQNAKGLVDDNTVYLTAFRTIDEYQNKGYFSKLFRFMIKDLKEKGYTKATLGVEPEEIKNKKIYSSYGFTTHIKNGKEIYPDGTQIEVEYYSKTL